MPVVLILVGAHRLMSRLWADDSGHPGSGLTVMLVGVVFLLETQHVASLRQTWPAFLVIGGLGALIEELWDRRGSEVRDDR